MKLSINYDEQDVDVVPEITTVCDKLGLEYVLEERNDWMTHGVRPQCAESNLALFVVSPVTTTSWWLPFQIGRSVERQVTIVSYVRDSTKTTPKYLKAGEVVRRPENLKSMLCRLTSRQELS